MLKDQIAMGIVAGRRSASLTQAQLAKRLGIDKQTISRWERGTNTPRWNMLPRIADALGLTEDELIGSHGESLQQAS